MTGKKLDRLMADAGVDLVLANSRENVRYLCGGYYFHFHERFTALGHGQYMALAGVPRGDAGIEIVPDRRGRRARPGERPESLDT